MYLEHSFVNETINRSFHFNKFNKSVFINNFEYFIAFYCHKNGAIGDYKWCWRNSSFFVAFNLIALQ